MQPSIPREATGEVDTVPAPALATSQAVVGIQRHLAIGRCDKPVTTAAVIAWVQAALMALAMVYMVTMKILVQGPTAMIGMPPPLLMESLSHIARVSQLLLSGIKATAVKGLIHKIKVLEWLLFLI